jgi:hypothetical protein
MQYKNRPEVRVLWNASSSIVIEITGEYDADGDASQAANGPASKNKLSFHRKTTEPRNSEFGNNHSRVARIVMSNQVSHLPSIPQTSFHFNGLFPIALACAMNCHENVGIHAIRRPTTGDAPRQAF